MSARPIENPVWPLRKWLLIGAGVLAVQLALVALLGYTRAPKTTPPTNPVSAPVASDFGAQLPMAENAAAFVLPNRAGFSGPAWLESPNQEIAVKDWTDKPRPLEPRVEKLCGDLDTLLKSPPSASPGEASFDTSTRLDPPSLEMNAVDAGQLSLEGDLSTLKLLNSPRLEPQPAADNGLTLDNTTVRTGVDENGIVVSAILYSKSGSAAADMAALKIAQSSRFQIPGSNDPARPGNRAILWGLLVFHWQTADAPSLKLGTAQ